MEDKSLNKKKYLLIVSIFSTIIILLGSAYAFFSYFKSASAFTLRSNSITATFTEGTNQISFTNAYPISDEYALQNLDKLDYIDFTVSGSATNSSEAVTYEIFLTENQNNTLDKNYIKTYVTDNNGSALSNPTMYGSLPLTTYSNEPTGRVVLQKTYAGTFTKSYRLYIWLDSTYEQNTVSQTFSFYVNIYAYNNTSDNSNKTLSEKIQELSTTTNYVKNYTTKQDVYYFTGADAKANGNVLFGGLCWQIIRTTDTGGVKLIYNGVAENNQCKTDRTAGKGINGSDGTQKTTMTSVTVYGTGFDYDLNAGTFTLTGTSELSGKTWASNASELIGTYTCLNSSSTCSTLYYVGHYQSATEASTASYTIGDNANYSQIGTSAYNAYYDSPALVGYMYNKAYTYEYSAKTGNHYANSVTYSNGTYTLVNPTSDVASAPSVGYKYVCNDSEIINGDVITCSTPKVKYYYYDNKYHVTLENGDTNPVYVMLNGKTQGETVDANINVYSSAIKRYLDNWYKKNIETLSTSVKGLIDTSAVYCNDRSSSNTFGSWDKDAANNRTNLYFKQNSVNKD